MAATKPATALEWASSNPTDGTSGQPAIIAPTAGKIASGFTRLEKPPRQDFNWFFNLVTLWNDYFEALTDSHELNIVEEIDSTDLPNDLTTSNTILKTALESKYLSDDIVEGFRILNVVLTAGVKVGVTVTRGRAKTYTFAGSNRKLLRSRNYQGPTTKIQKNLVESGALAPYAPGDDAGGAGSSTVLTDNTWYHIFVIYDGNTGFWDVAFSTFVTGGDVAVASGGIRRVGSIYYDNITRGFYPTLQYGDYFYRKVSDPAVGYPLESAVTVDISGGTGGASVTLDVSQYLPTDVDVIAIVDWSVRIVSGSSSAPAYCSILSKGFDGVADINLASADAITYDGTARPNDMVCGQKRVLVRGDDQNLVLIGSSADLSATNLFQYYITIKGYVDLRGNDYGYSSAGFHSYIRGA